MAIGRMMTGGEADPTAIGIEKMPPMKDETQEKARVLHIEIGEDGYSYSVMGAEGKEKEYKTDNPDEVLGWVKDDLGTPHMKGKTGDFERMKNRIMSRPGFKPRYSGQSKEQAASAVTASLKDKLMPGWRKD